LKHPLSTAPHEKWGSTDRSKERIESRVAAYGKPSNLTKRVGVSTRGERKGLTKKDRGPVRTVTKYRGTQSNNKVGGLPGVISKLFGVPT